MTDFGDVYLSAEQVTERHDPAPHDKDTQPVDLPGVVNVYLHIGGGKLLFTQYKAGKVFDAIEQAQQAQADQPQDASSPPTQTSQPSEPSPGIESQPPPAQQPDRV